ncbi:Uncharacterised protein [uncultured archaeon]|nr:Uncharacterised protein [uncultured archaeon]
MNANLSMDKFVSFDTEKYITYNLKPNYITLYDVHLLDADKGLPQAKLESRYDQKSVLLGVTKQKQNWITAFIPYVKSDNTNQFNEPKEKDIQQDFSNIPTTIRTQAELRFSLETSKTNSNSIFVLASENDNKKTFVVNDYSQLISKPSNGFGFQLKGLVSSTETRIYPLIATITRVSNAYFDGESHLKHGSITYNLRISFILNKI